MNKKTPKSTPAKAPGTALPGSPMDLSLLERIVKLMIANDLNTVEVRDGNRRLVLHRGAAESAAPATAARPAAPGTAAPAAPVAPVDENAGLHPIKSPMVGTFYAATSPDAKPLVSVGSAVDEDTDVCIIEAMKVFNNIKSECRGTIAKILAQNGQTVEYGQVLFLVKPN